ncbi:Sec1 domain containing protein 1 [Goodea atripinnis]|uniref:Sec1 domain containing protein 1 n=1 Tax=Goodea atripinnis TaxID=208336 RepID=A0ABV0Q1W2_9TELE
MEMKSHPETDDYRYFDPKMLRGSESSIPRNKNPFQEAIVFVVGGGNYIEYQNLVDYAKVLQCCHSVFCWRSPTCTSSTCSTFMILLLLYSKF